MNRLRSSLMALRLIALVIGLTGMVRAADVSNPPATNSASSVSPAQAAIARLMPPSPAAVPTSVSPVALFRNLLNMTPRQRADYLTNRPPQIRAALQDKIHEYLVMDPDTRELRLRATELRWQLIPLLRTAPADRGPRLAQVPDDLAPLVKSRLAEWDQLPTAMQQEFLIYDRTLHYFATVNATNQPATDSAAEARQQSVAAQFNQFIELTPEEQKGALKTISATERAQMEATLKAFGKLPPAQRFECLRAFAKFTELSPADRAEFLKNASRWAEMTPRERQTWRDLVARVPLWPPMPPVALPMPPRLPPFKVHPVVATNQGEAGNKPDN